MASTSKLTSESAYTPLQAFVDSPDESAKTLEALGPILEKFLFEADLLSQTSVQLLRDLEKKRAQIRYPQDQSTAEKIHSLLLLAHFMQQNQLSSTCLETLSTPYATEPMKYPPNTSCTSIFVCAYEDEATIDNSIMTLQDKTPLIVPSRIFAPMIPRLNESILSDTTWWIYQTSTHDIILFLPKQGEDSALHALQRFGYDSTQLMPLNCSELIKDVQKFDGMSNESYLEQICQRIPPLFVNPVIKKRVHIFGHGGVISNPKGKECYTIGMKIEQTRIFLEELAHRGMDYCNLITCHGGKHLVQLLGNQKRSYTVSVCSIGDFVVNIGYKIPEIPHMQVHLTDTARFWNRINVVLSQEDVLTAEKFASALEYVYGRTISGMPQVSLKGNPRFTTINVHPRICMLDSSCNRGGGQPFNANCEFIVVIPPAIDFPIFVKKSPFSGYFPPILSRISDDNHLFLSALKTDEADIMELIKQCLFFDLPGPDYCKTSTRVVVIKEATGLEYWGTDTYLNIVTVIPPNSEGQFIIFQKKDQLDKWFARGGWILSGEEEVDAAEVQIALYLVMRIKTKPEAYSCLEGEGSIPRNEVASNYYKKWFENFVGNDLLIEGVEAIDNNTLARLEQIAAQLDSSSCRALLVHAVKKNNLQAVQILGKKATGIDKTCISGKRLLIEATLNSPLQIVEALLEIGCQPNKVYEYYSPLDIAIDKKEEAKVEILCRHGALLHGMPEKCIQLKSQSCLDIVVKYLPQEYSLSGAVKTAIKTDQLDLALRLIKEKGAAITSECLEAARKNPQLFAELSNLRKSTP